MASYATTKQSLVKERMSATIMGAPLDGGPFKDWFPIRPCVCVTAEGCPCTIFDDIVVWLPPDATVEKTGHRCEGEDIISYEVPLDSKILVETQIPLTVGELQRLKGLAERGSRKTISVLQKSTNTKKGKPSVGALLIGAFELGWHIGEKIDEETGASDKISDWLAENLPWPW